MRPILSRLARLAGYAIVGAACVFVVIRVAETGLAEAMATSGSAVLLAVIGGGVIYGAAGFLLAGAWMRILRLCGQAPPRRRLGFAIYARTQIGKYLPGNVFHLVGRHLSGRALGLDHAPMVCAAWFESVALVSAAAALSLPGVTLWNRLGTDLPGAVVATVAGIAVSMPFVLVLALPTIARLAGQSLPSRRAADLLAGLLPAYLLHLAFFAVAGAILWLLGFGLSGADPALLPYFVAITTGAWILGYLTPGAAAGIGVREALLIAGLSEGLGIQNAALIALAFRAATLSGDALFFLAGLSLASDRIARWLWSRAASADPGGKTGGP